MSPSAIGQIRYAIDQGVNYVDTAWPYHAGESETVLGKALRDGYRNRVKLATKLPSWMIKSRADMDRFLAAQLEKLGTDQIDYYLVHALNGKLWDNVERLGVLDFLEQAKRDGRIVNAGFSFHGLADDFKPHRRCLPVGLLPDSIQLPGRKQPGRHRGPGIRRRQGPGRDRHGTAARRKPGVGHSAAGRCGDLERGQSPAHAGRMGAALGLEPAGSHGGPLRHEPGGAGAGEPGHRRYGPCPTP